MQALSEVGQTQCCECSPGGFAVWSHPVDVKYRTTSLTGANTHENLNKLCANTHENLNKLCANSHENLNKLCANTHENLNKLCANSHENLSKLCASLLINHSRPSQDGHRCSSKSGRRTEEAGMRL
eukprot:765035-Hanusia_phi.AAC.10